MAKYIDADKLLAEIKRLYKQNKCDFDNGCYNEDQCCGYDIALLDLRIILNSLQQEQPEVDLENYFKGWHVEEEIGLTKPDGWSCIVDDLKDIAHHLYELGQRRAAEMYDEIEYNRQRAVEEMLGKTLDEAAYKYAPDLASYIGGSISIAPESRQDLRDAFIAGAKWMAGQGVTLKVTDDTTWGEVNDFIHRNCDGVKEIKIRKKED